MVEDISPKEAWNLLSSSPDCQLVDVRSAPEWVFAGMPDLRALNKDAHGISWKLFPQWQQNPHFIEALCEQVPDKNADVIFLCKVGGRSYDAALAAANEGYTKCYNIVNGFEGEPDGLQQRGKLNGWKADGLPWFQQ